MSLLLYEELTFKLIGAAKLVYRVLGPGFLESVYEEAFLYELRKRNLKYVRQIDIDVYYKELVLPKKFRADLMVEDKILIENKAIKNLTNIDVAQLINYLKSTKLRIGLIFNYGSKPFEFMRRII